MKLRNIPLIPDLSPIKQTLENNPATILYPPLELCLAYTPNKNSKIIYYSTPQYNNYFKQIPDITKPYQNCSTIQDQNKLYLHPTDLLYSTDKYLQQSIFTKQFNILFTYTLDIPQETKIALISRILSFPDYTTTIISEIHLKNYLNLSPTSAIYCQRDNYILYFYNISNNSFCSQ